MEVDRTVGDADRTSESKAAPRRSATTRKRAASAVEIRRIQCGSENSSEGCRTRG